MLDYTKFGAQTMPGQDEEDVRRRQAAVQQQPSTPPQPQPYQQPQQQPVAQPSAQPNTLSGPSTQPIPSSGGSTASAPTFAQLQAAGIPRPAPPQLPTYTAPVPGVTQQDPAGTVRDASGNKVGTLDASGNRTPGYGFGGYDPNNPAQGYDSRAWQMNQDDINKRQAYAYTTADGRTIGGKSEGMGDSFGSAQEFQQYLASLPNDSARQIAMFANPKALQMLQAAGTPQGMPQTDPRANQTLGGAVSGAATNGSPNGGPLGGDILTTLRGLLQNPTAYGSDAMQREFQQGARQIDDDYTQRRKGLDEEMARRGIYDSTIAGTGLSDLNVGRRSAQVELMDRLLSKRADAQDSGLRSALSAAMGYDSDVAGRGERAADRAQQESQFARNYGLDERRFTSDDQFRNKQFDADEKARQDALLAAWYQMFGL